MKAENGHLANLLITPSVRMVTLFLFFLTMYRIAMIFAPDLVHTIKSTFINLPSYTTTSDKWTEEDRLNDPKGYMLWAEKKMLDQENNIEEVIKKLREESIGIDHDIEEHTMSIGKIDAFLNDGRIIYKKALATGTLPINFAGRKYETTSLFKSQLQLLYQEKQTKEMQLVSLQQIKTKLNKKLLPMMLQKGRLEITRKTIRPKLHLFEAGERIDSIQAILDNTLATVEDTEALLSNDSKQIGTMKELMETDPNASFIDNASGQKFNQFLNQ